MGPKGLASFSICFPGWGPVKQELVQQKAVQIHFTKAVLYSFI
jgi:hypothetical protein